MSYTKNLEKLFWAKVSDLREQAEMFDMMVDWETLELVPKRVDATPQWLKNYRDRLNDDDKHHDHINQMMEGKDEM